VPPDIGELARQRALAVDGARERTVAPVAHVAADAATAHGEAFDDALARAGEYARAESAGLVLRELPLAVIDIDHLHRDRCADDDEAMTALKTSIETHGLRSPIEVMPRTETAERFALISGRRRVLALRDLFAASGDARYARVKAIVRPHLPARAAYVAMVEENEVRADLSFYERGRIAVLVAELGLYADTAAAVDALFASASPAKRSKIRSFARIHEALGSTLCHPTALGERLGLKLAEALRQGSPSALGEALARAGPFADAASEQAAIHRLLDAPAPAAPDEAAPPRRGRPRRAPATTTELRPGVRLERRSLEAGVELRVFGPSLDAAVADRIAEVVARLLDDEAIEGP